MSKKVAVILSGCGVFDGAEIHEAVLSLYAIDKHGADYQVFAPDRPQYHVVNHITGKEMNETRNMLVEAARIARGKIKELSEYQPADYDALLLPGGFGVAKNFCNYAVEGPGMEIQTDIERMLKAQLAAGKPIGALCISPVLLAKITGAKVTVGDSESDIENTVKLGGTAISTKYNEVVIDEKYNIVTAACYQLNSNVYEVGVGAENVVKELLKIA